MSDPSNKYLHWGRVPLSVLGQQGGTGQQSDVPMTGDIIENYLAAQGGTTPNMTHANPWANGGGRTPTQMLPGGVPMYGFNEDTRTSPRITDLWLRTMMQRLGDLGQQ